MSTFATCENFEVNIKKHLRIDKTWANVALGIVWLLLGYLFIVVLIPWVQN